MSNTLMLILLVAIVLICCDGCTVTHPDCAEICLRAHSPECKGMTTCLTKCVDGKRRE